MINSDLRGSLIIGIIAIAAFGFLYAKGMISFAPPCKGEHSFSIGGSWQQGGCQERPR